MVNFRFKSSASRHQNRHTITVPENSPLAGKSLAKIQLRKKYGILVLAICRNSKIISNPDSNIQLCAEDELFVLGAPDKISELGRLIINSKESV
ncbi:MAG: hypothetical protein GY798_19725 [Hyphomicrobiales bacterium]|nr:hypothetical protein [Hyphomicrobiales bacterium]